MLPFTPVSCANWAIIAYEAATSCLDSALLGNDWVTLDQLQDSPFDKIIKGETRIQALYEDERVIVFPASRPIANIHYIVLSKNL